MIPRGGNDARDIYWAAIDGRTGVHNVGVKAPGHDLEISPHGDGHNSGQGLSRGLARGLLVTRAGRDITGEGMGIGAPALHAGYAYFASRCETETGPDGAIVKTFLLDRRAVAVFRDRPLPLYTRFSERWLRIVRRSSLLRRTLFSLSLSARIKKLAGMGMRFENVSPRAQARFTYRLEGPTIDVSCRIVLLHDSPAVICLMNEIGADAVDVAMRRGRKVPLPGWWDPLPPGRGEAALCSRHGGFRFTVGPLNCDRPAVVRKFWGREMTHNLCWAGIDYEIGPIRTGEISFGYRVEFHRTVNNDAS